MEKVMPLILNVSEELLEYFERTFPEKVLLLMRRFIRYLIQQQRTNAKILMLSTRTKKPAKESWKSRQIIRLIQLSARQQNILND